MQAYGQSLRWPVRPAQRRVFLAFGALYFGTLMVIGIINGDPRLWSPVLLFCVCSQSLVVGAIKRHKIKRALS
jgi:hypothetical protein